MATEKLTENAYVNGTVFFPDPVPEGQWCEDIKSTPSIILFDDRGDLERRLKHRDNICQKCSNHRDRICSPDNKEKGCKQNSWDCPPNVRPFSKKYSEGALKDLLAIWLESVAKTLTSLAPSYCYPQTREETVRVLIVKCQEGKLALQLRNAQTKDGDIGMRRYMTRVFRNALVDVWKEETKEQAQDSSTFDGNRPVHSVQDGGDHTRQYGHFLALIMDIREKFKQNPVFVKEILRWTRTLSELELTVFRMHHRLNIPCTEIAETLCLEYKQVRDARISAEKKLRNKAREMGLEF